MIGPPSAPTDNPFYVAATGRLFFSRLAAIRLRLPLRSNASGNVQGDGERGPCTGRETQLGSCLRWKCSIRDAGR